jgi:hypothetical protein
MWLQVRRPVWFNGGRGALISRGLLDAVPTQAWLHCEQHEKSGVQDAKNEMK